MKKIALYKIPLMMVTLLFLGGQAIAENNTCDAYEGSAYGLCTAYCEAMDCDNEEHHANKKACDVVYLRFVKKAGNPPPCEVDPCPAWDSGELESMWDTYESMCFMDDQRLYFPHDQSGVMWGDAAVYDDDNYVWANIQFFPYIKAVWGQVKDGITLKKKEWPLNNFDEYRACRDRLIEHVPPVGFSSCNP
jgi:hypothetical protein